MNYKKSISLGLVLSLALGTNVSALSSTDELLALMKEKNLPVSTLQYQISQEETLQALKKTDKVRVIVEMEQNAIIESATSKGISIEKMDKTELLKLQSDAENIQEKVQNKIKAKGISFEKINSFTNVVNGFSATTTLENAKKMEAVSGVKSVTIVNEYERPTPAMNSSNEITEAIKTWANGYEGEGMVISIIDTGIDSKHKDMRLDDVSKADLEKSEVDELIKDNSLSGEFFTDKVPYGYNYMDNNMEIRDLGPDASMHGMHVAGIAAANGDVESGGIKGTAPEAQLLAMKVFGNNPEMASTFGDVIIKAIDDSVALGADVINMSLGSTASFVNDEDPEQVAVNRAVDNGVLVSISAGNSTAFGDGWDYPYAANPDYGVSGSPGLATDSLQVASLENNITTGYGIEFMVEGKKQVYPYTTSGTDILSVYKGENLKVVDCGIGKPEEFTAEVKGNVALIQRGTLDFTAKITNAAAAGAKAVVVYNSASGGDALINMAYPEGLTIPALFIGQSAGLMIKDNSVKSDFTISFNGAEAKAQNPLAGQMSDFTSWGLTPDLEFKPEITGVGGNVWSTANDNGYQNMSGTSMAAPNVAGGAALVLEMLEEKYPEVTGEAKSVLAKNIMMSTAVPNIDRAYEKYAVVAGDNYTSPRRQGAGVMNLAAATSTPAIVTDSTTGISKVNLKEIKEDKAIFTIKVQNLSDKAVTYQLSGNVQTDIADEGYSLLQAQNIIDKTTNEFPISYSKNEITVEANKTAEITVTVDLSNAITAYNETTLEEVFVNGGYVEGFVTLTDPTDSNPTLNIPYVGFKGEWDKAPTIDASIYDKDNISFYGYTAMLSPVGEGQYNYLGLSYDASKAEDTSKADGSFIDFSPNGDNVVDEVVPMLSYLRNIKEMEIQILDSKGNVVRTLANYEDLRKHFFDSQNEIYSIMDDATWDGTINGKPAAEGTYTYRVATKIDFEGAKWQYNDFKINLDNTAPKFESYAIDNEGKTLTIKAEDNFKGHIYAYMLSTPISEIGEEKVILNSTGVFDISEELAAGYGVNDFFVGLIDYAQNFTPVDLGEPTGPAKGDKTAPVVKVLSPEFFGTFNENTVVFSGTVSDDSSIADFTIAGEKPELTYNVGEKVWEFSHTLTLEDGYQSVYVNAKDSAGNELGFAHKIFVDSANPIIVANYVDPVTTADTVNIKAKITDNFPDLKITINGELIENIVENWEYFDQLDPASYELNYKYNLEPGVNNIELKVSDGSGNVVTKVFTVEKVADMAIKTKELVGDNRYETAIKISNEGWTNSNFAVIANGEAYVDALVAAPLAASKEAPILLSEKDVLTPSTAKELQRLGVQEVFIIGGTGVISNEVATDIANLGIKVTRIGGADRYETSLRVAKYLERENDIAKVYVVGGQAIPDAVTISPKAAEEVAPIILVETNTVDKSILTWLSDAKVNSAHVIGGIGVVNEAVVNKLSQVNNKAIIVDRTAGNDRYATSAAVIDRFYESYAEKVMVTESTILVDAMVVAPYAAKYGAPVVITNNTLSAEQKAVMDKMIAKEVVKVGGQVSKDVMLDIAKRLNK